MKIHEYQAKAILAQYNVPVPRGQVAYTVEEAEAAARALGGSVVVKAQIHAGGRGKGGGVKVAKDAVEALELARKIMGMTLHIIEGSKEEIERQLRTRVEAFFDLYPEI